MHRYEILLINLRYVPITDTNPILYTFWCLILSMKMSIFSIVMSIIKAINDAIITRNDIFSTCIPISFNEYQYYK